MLDFFDKNEKVIAAVLFALLVTMLGVGLLKAVCALIAATDLGTGLAFSMFPMLALGYLVGDYYFPSR